MNYSKLESEFKMLENITKTKETLNRLFDSRQCPYVNRYNDVSAYADTCATIDRLPPNCANFVHANFIPSPYNKWEKPVFIATQAPKPITLPNFFKLIFNYGIPLVITILQQNEIVKDFNTNNERVPFWRPDRVTQHTSAFHLQATTPIDYPGVRVRTLTLSEVGGNQRTTPFYHFNINAWPDKDIPDDNMIGSLIWVFKTQRQFYQTNKTLALVHCSAGIGRTGTFMIAYFLYDHYLTCREKRQSFTPNIFQMVSHLRQYRYMAVQTSIQYQFLHMFLERLPAIADLH